MDTRTKIISYKECLERMREAGAPGVVAVGYFDPVLAWHAARLRGWAEEGRRLAAWIVEPPDPLLPAGARAELVAALDCVEMVAVVPEGAAQEVPAGWRVRREEGAELAGREELARRVWERQPAG